jgi:hypothetical protein
MIDNPHDTQYPNKVYNVGLINRAKAREYILDLCSKLKPQYTRISPDFLAEIEQEIKTVIKEKVVFCESKKKTLK